MYFCNALYHDRCQKTRTHSLNPFPQQNFGPDQIETLADHKLNVTKVIIFFFDRVENIVGKEEIVCRSNFSFSHNVFKRLLSQTRQKVSFCGMG